MKRHLQPKTMCIEWKNTRGEELSLTFDLTSAAESEVARRLIDGCRCMRCSDRNSDLVTILFGYGPPREWEMERLGLLGAKYLRVRAEPERRWIPGGPVPFDLEPFVGRPIPEELQGRVGTIVRLAPFKYGQTLTLELHRPKSGTPGARRSARPKVVLPFIWLEPLEEKGSVQ